MASPNVFPRFLKAGTTSGTIVADGFSVSLSGGLQVSLLTNNRIVDLPADLAVSLADTGIGVCVSDSGVSVTLDSSSIDVEICT